MRPRISRAASPGSQEESLKLALRFLGYRARSETEVQTRLERQGFAVETIRKTLDKLRSLNYLNDEVFARDWARHRAESRGYGPGRIERELRTKGIAPSLVEEVLRGTFRSGEEQQRAKALLEKRFREKNLGDPKILRRAVAFLRRRGYGSGVIMDLLRRPQQDDLIEDE